MKIVIRSFMIVVAFALLSCGGHKEIQFEKEGALTFKKATYSKWVAGIQGGGAGYNIYIELDDVSSTTELLDVYFKNYKTSLKIDNKGVYIGSIKTNENTDVISPNSSGSVTKKDTDKEVAEAFPFTLNGNEAVVVYKENDKKMYYKLTLTKASTLEKPRQ